MNPNVSIAEKTIMLEAEYASITLESGVEIRLIMKTRDDEIRAPFERIFSPEGERLWWSFVPTEGNIQQSDVPAFEDVANAWLDYINGDDSMLNGHAGFEHAITEYNERS